MEAHVASPANSRGASGASFLVSLLHPCGFVGRLFSRSHPLARLRAGFGGLGFRFRIWFSLLLACAQGASSGGGHITRGPAWSKGPWSSAVC